MLTQEQIQTLQYWKGRFPALYKKALASSGATGQPGFGQAATDTQSTSTFNSVLGSLSSLLTSYGQYKVATDVATSRTAANGGLMALPGSGTTTGTNYLLWGGVALVAIVAGVLMFKKKRG